MAWALRGRRRHRRGFQDQASGLRRRERKKLVVLVDSSDGGRDESSALGSSIAADETRAI